jgi:hypothetical protein
MSRISTRHFADVTRIYKNATDEVIGMDQISISVAKNSIAVTNRDHTNEPRQMFDVYVDKITKIRTRIHEGAGGDRTIATIQMIGTYDSIQEDSGNFLNATWTAVAINETDLIVNFNSIDVALVGESL